MQLFSEEKVVSGLVLRCVALSFFLSKCLSIHVCTDVDNIAYFHEIHGAFIITVCIFIRVSRILLAYYNYYI